MYYIVATIIMLLITENHYTFISAELLFFRALANVGGSTLSSHVLDCLGTRCSIGQVIQYLDKQDLYHKSIIQFKITSLRRQ